MSTATAHRLTAILHREHEVVVAGCPEVGTVSQGDTVEEALANLREVTELFLQECPQLLQVRPVLTESDRQLIDRRIESFLADGDSGLDALEQSLCRAPSLSGDRWLSLPEWVQPSDLERKR